MPINFNNFWYVDGRITKVLHHIYISHLTSRISLHFLVKHKSTEFAFRNLAALKSIYLPGWQSEWGIGYYRDNLLAQELLPYIFWISQGGFCLSTGRGIEHATPSLSWSERYSTSFLQQCGRRIHRILIKSTIYSICSVLQEKVYPSRIANVDELKTRLIDEWKHFHQSIVDAAIAEWRRCHSACVRVSWAHFGHEFQ